LIFLRNMPKVLETKLKRKARKIGLGKKSVMKPEEEEIPATLN